MAKKNQLSQSAAWIFAFFGAVLVASIGYLILLSLQENRMAELAQKDKEKQALIEKRKQERKKALEELKKQKSPSTSVVANSAANSAYWSYEGKTYPGEWANLSADYVLCAHGKKQSPIDLVDPVPTPSLPSLNIKYKKEELHVANDGRTIFIDVPNKNNTLKFKKKAYTLEKITFHTPSEHFLEGAPYEMEIQLHHKGSDGQNLNLSVFVDAMGSTNKTLKALWEDLPYSREEVGASHRMNPRDFLPIGRRYYTYQGSMTTPPCSENVTWIIMQDPIKMSIRQLDHFRTVIKQNARPVQKIWGKKLRISRVY